MSFPRNNVAELLHLADYFSLAKLRGHCLEFLHRHLAVRNVLSVVELASKHNLSTDLLKQAFNLVRRHFAALCQRPDMFKAFGSQTIHQFLSEQRFNLSAESILSFVSRWTNFNVEIREDQLANLLHFVQFNSINPNFICELIDREPLYENCPEVRI